MQDQPTEQPTKIADAAPAPLASWEHFPTPDEVATTELSVGAIEYIEETDGVSPIMTGAYLEHLQTRPMRAIRTLIVAIANAYELQHGLPLRWSVDHVRSMTVSAAQEYLTRVVEVAGFQATRAGDNGSRPTPAATPRRPTTKRRPSQRKRSTGPSSRTGSTTNTDGPPSSSVG